MKNFLHVLIFCLALLGILANKAWGQAVVVGWDFSTLLGGTNNFGPSPYAPTTTATGVTITGLTRGTGVGTTGTGAANAWGGNDFASTTQVDAITNNDFVTFQITVNSGFTLSLTSVEPYNIRRSNTGPTTGIWQYRINTGSFVDIGTAITWGTVTTAVGNPQSSIDLSSITALQNLTAGTVVTFRVVNWSGAAAGTWYFNDPSDTTPDDLVIKGTLIGNYYSKSTGSLDVLSTWGTNTDGTGPSPANFSTVNINYHIRNNANPTIGTSWNITGAGSKVVVGDGTNPCTFSIPDGMTVTSPLLEVSNHATLNTNQTGTLSGTGSFTLGAGATLRTAHTSGVSGSITVSGTQTYNLGANYEFNNASANQNAGFPTSLTTMNNLIINTGATNRVNLNKTISVNGTVTLTQGDLNLNGFNVLLGTSGSIAENIALQHLIKDLTATTDTGVQGGYIEATNRTVNTGTGQIAGLGVYLQTSSGSYNDLQVRRYHYTANNGKGIRVIYQLSSPSVGANPTTIGFRMPTTEENPNSLTLNRVYRWTSMLGWQFIGTSVSCASLGADICTNTTQTAFSSWTLGNDTNAQLPITLVSFNAKRAEKNSEKVEITWATAQEINNQVFEVQFSSDLKEFTPIAFVDGAGNSHTRKDYQILVNNSLAGYYRLKQINFDGSYEYTPVVFVEKSQNISQVRIYPNPVSEAVYFEGLEQNQTYIFKLQNAQGQTLQIVENSQEWASQSLSNILKEQKAGVYFIQIFSDGKPIATLKAIKL